MLYKTVHAEVKWIPSQRSEKYMRGMPAGMQGKEKEQQNNKNLNCIYLQFFFIHIQRLSSVNRHFSTFHF